MYKELMLMGVVSFLIMLVQAARTADNYILAAEGCFSRYALKAIDRSFYSWGVMLILIVLNYTREVFGIRFDGCGPDANAHSSSHSSSSEEVTEGGGHRMLSGGEAPPEATQHCVYGDHVHLPLVQDQEKLAKMIHKDARGALQRDRMTMKELKLEIERVLDEDEHEEEAEFKELAEALSFISTSIKESVATAMLNCRVLIKYLRNGCKNVDPVNENGGIANLLSDQHPPNPSPPDSNDPSPAIDNQAHTSIKASDKSRGPLVPVLDLASPRARSSILIVQPTQEHGHDADDSGGHGGHQSNRKAEMKKRLTIRGSFSVNSAENSPRIPSLDGNSPRPTAGYTALDNISEEAASLVDHGSEKKKKVAINPPTTAHAAVAPVTTVSPPPSNSTSPKLQLRKKSNPSSPSQSAKRQSGGSPASHNAANHKHRNSNVDKSNVMQLLNTINFQDESNAMLMSNSTKMNTPSLGPVNKAPGGNRRNSVAVHAPENNYSTIEKFRKQKLLEKRKIHGEGYKIPGSPRGENVNNASGWFFWPFHNKVDPADKHDGGDVEAHVEEEFRLSSDFSDIFLFNMPELFFGAVEMCIMFNCLYLAFWVTDFISLSARQHQTAWEHVLFQLGMAVPAVIVIPCIGYIIETCSLLRAISDLNLDVVHDVLEEREDTKLILRDLRNKMIRRIEVLESLNHDKQEIILALFNEIDQDGSGNIDKLEFRFLLRALKLTFSNDRFNRLFRAVDTSGDGMLSIEELFDLLFPKYDPDEDEENEDMHSRPSQSRRGRTSSADCPPIPEEEENSPGGPSQGLQRLRSLSQISDYSDTDSENDNDKEKDKKKNKRKGSGGVVQETCRDEDDDDDDSARTPPSILRQRNTKANTSANKIVPAITSSMSTDTHDYHYHRSDHNNQNFVLHGDGKDHEGDGCFNSVTGSSSRPFLFSVDNGNRNNSGDMHVVDHSGEGNHHMDGEEDGKDSHEGGL
eukprot:scaffold504_cov189-Ochromonas_danica.AAC.31